MRDKPTIRRSLALLAAVLMVTSVLGPVGIVAAVDGITVTQQADSTTVNPGDTITFTTDVAVDGSQINTASVGLQEDLPDGWSVTSRSPGDEFITGPDGWLWFGGTSGVDGSDTVEYTVAVPDSASAGEYTPSITASTEGGESTTASTTITVEDTGNTAPTIDPISDQTVTEGDSTTVPVSASDAEGDSVSLSLSQSPDFVSLSNGEITIAPQSGDAANSPYTVEVTADDGTDTTTESFQVTVEEPEPQTTSASVAINPGAGVEASTYTSGSYQVTNTGDTNIQTLTVDLSETMLPDMVFDPFNTAGDDVGKEFTLDGGDVTVENVEYTNFHNGVDNDAGYDTLVVTLSGFESGETMSFSIDNDPTSIDTTDLGSQAAGPVSGLEITGGTISVDSGSGPIESTIVGDGSAGGATATVQEDTDESVPSLDVDGVSLSSTTLSDRHSAATVASADQTVTITGAPANSEVTLLRVEGELNLNDVPTGYEIEDYEANKANQVQYYTTTTDSNGEATVDVTLTDTGAVEESGLNYFTAWVDEPNGDTGPVSDYVILELDPDAANTAPTIDAITDQGVTEGESATVNVPASDADGDDLTYSVSGSGAAFVTANGDGTLTIEPGVDAVGTYTVTVTADDGSATASEEFAVYVDEPDQDGEVVFAANAGGSEYTAADGTTYQAGADASALASGPTYSVSQSIANTEDDTLYQTERYGGSSGNAPPNLALDVEDGTYEVTLKFAEIFQGVAGSDSPDSTTPPTDGTNENDRLFDVTVEGQQVLTEYDIFSEVGPLTATDKTYTVEVTDGTLNVDFAVTNDNAKLSAIKIEQIDTADDAPGPVVGEDAPTDPDGDGLYEDVNGDGSVNVGDAQAIFSNQDDSVVQNNVAAFDYNGDGSIDVGDAQALFANGIEAGDGTEA